MLGTIVSGAVTMLRAHPEAREVRMTVDLPTDVEVYADSSKLGRAIFNLLLNGCQAARRGSGPPEVGISAEHEAALLRIRIEDSGPGIARNIKETLFDPFVSAGKQSGIGLGLTLALHIVQEHGGTVKLSESALGWTVFTIELPLSQSTHSITVPPEETATI
jgi:signal transduction histidine kinase